jgi:hypothetical protein
MEPGNHADPNNKVLNSKLTIQSTLPPACGGGGGGGGGGSLKGADRKNFQSIRNMNINEVIIPIFYLR